MDFTDINQYCHPHTSIASHTETNCPRITDSPPIQHKQPTHAIHNLTLSLYSCHPEIVYFQTLVDQILSQVYSYSNGVNKSISNCSVNFLNKQVSRLTNSIKGKHSINEDNENKMELIKEPSIDDPQRIQVKVFKITRCTCSILQITLWCLYYIIIPLKI